MKPVIIIAIAFVLLIPSSIQSINGLEEFVDPNKDPQHYVDRYKNEITYREWFDKNYPDITIYKAVGLPEPEVTADDQYKMICSAPDGYCMGLYGMNNPDAYGSCLGTWVPFCQTYETKQTPVTNLDDIQPLLDKGNALANEKKYAEALEQFDKVLGMTDHEIVQGKVFLAKAVIYFNMDEYETAIKYYDKVLKIEPQHPQALLDKGILYQETKQWQNSIDMFEQVLDYPEEDVSGYIAFSQQRLDAHEAIEKRGGGCLIATATYGSELAPQVQQLRELRDNQLLQTESGTSFINTFNDFYYSFSPIIADYERENPIFKEMVKIAITPMISSLSILNYVDMDSEVEVLGYGISLILLNGMMYFGIPAIVIMRIRK